MEGGEIRDRRYETGAGREWKACALAFKEEGLQAKEPRQPLEARKGTDSSPEPLEGVWLC